MQKENRVTKCLLMSVLMVQALGLLLYPLQTEAQSNINPNSFVSAADQDLTVRSVTIVPFTDNIKGIYSTPLYKHFVELVSNDKQWGYLPFEDATKSAILDLEDDPDAVKSILASSKADALFTYRLTKGPRGLNARLTFFTGRSGAPLLQEELQNYSGFEIADLEKQLEIMYAKIKARLPYRGVVLSRRGQEVTINLGERDGLRNGDEVSVIQILKLNRHPKFKFLVGTEKEILGKVKVFKSDDSLSFANVIFEKEPGTVQPGMKLLSRDFIHYQDPNQDPNYGDNPRAWTPEAAPQYGRIAVLAGLGSYNQSLLLTSATGSIEAGSSFAPEIAIKGELWLNSEWNILYSLRQSVFTMENPVAGASPRSLNMALSNYSVLGAYNFLLSQDFFGPRIQLSAGYGAYSSQSDQSKPLAFANTNYGGLQFGMAGSFPMLSEVPVDLGAQLNLFLSPQMSESTPSGDAGKSSIIQFGFFGVYHLQSRFKIRAELNFDHYSTEFSGPTARATNSTQKRTSLLGGIEYLF